eukprot:COSAG03_NODE_267_length_9666_cov_13.197868_5_plen_73_part_00
MISRLHSSKQKYRAKCTFRFHYTGNSAGAHLSSCLRSVLYYIVLHRQCCAGRPASLLSFIHSFGLSWLAVRQ